MNAYSSLSLSQSEQEKLIEKLEIFTIQGTDRHGRTIIRIIGKFFSAKLVTLEALKKYLEEKVFPCLEERPFSVLYVNTGVNKNENFPGMSTLRSIFDAVPIKLKENLDTVYFLHPGLQSRIFLALFGRLLFGGSYWKLKYVNRLDLLWDCVRRKEIQMPEFIYEHDEELDYRPGPLVNFGIESDYSQSYCVTPIVDSAIPSYSMRCIA